MISVKTSGKNLSTLFYWFMNVAMNIVHSKGVSVIDGYFLLKTGALRVFPPDVFRLK